MNDPFSGIPDPGAPRPIRRPPQPGLIQEAVGSLRQTVNRSVPRVQRALQRAKWGTRDGFKRAQRYGQELWRRGQRNPRNVGIAAGAVALTLLGAYAVSASGGSLCPPVAKGKTPKFLVLMDSVPRLAAGSDIEIHYDVCGLASGTPYKGRVRLLQPQQQTAGKKKKKSAKPTPLVVSFKDRVDGVATRRQQPFKLGSTRPGTYTLELLVTDNKGRERKRVQKVVVKGR